jgi:hypothetical protein
MTEINDYNPALLIRAAERIAGLTAVPKAVEGSTPAETANKLLQLQKTVGERFVAHSASVLNALGNVNPTDAHLREMASRVKRDKEALKEVKQLMPGVPDDEALSFSMQFCAGCIDGAKLVRKDDKFEDKGTVVWKEIPETVRKQRMERVKQTCTGRPIHAAGVAIGPLDKKERHGQEPVFKGIEEADQDSYFPEYFRRYPRS